MSRPSRPRGTCGWARMSPTATGQTLVRELGAVTEAQIADLVIAQVRRNRGVGDASRHGGLAAAGPDSGDSPGDIAG